MRRSGLAAETTATVVVVVVVVLVLTTPIALLAVALLGAPTQPLVGMFGLYRILAAGDECTPAGVWPPAGPAADAGCR